MKYQLILMLSLFLFACQNNESKQEATETSQPKPDHEITQPTEVVPETFCYRHTYGENPNRQDVWEAELTVDGAKVSGTYNWIPFGKDSGRGLYLGVMDGGIITGTWNYTIEGSRQKEEVIFKMSDAELTRKRGKLVEENGVLRLENPAEANWEEAMLRVDCEG